MRYQFTTSAKEDLQSLQVYLRVNFGEEKSQAFIQYLQEQIKTLLEYPELGIVPRYRSLRLQGFRFLIIEKNYVFYKVDQDILTIIRILHQKQSFINL
jgi:toxin ParE1/3/4